MDIKKVLIVCKKSFYQIYFLKHNSASSPKSARKTAGLNASMLAGFKKNHDEHYKTLAQVKQALRARNISFKICYRGQNVDYTQFDFVVTVGGDGTFLEAARHVKRQVMLGVNSDSERTIGRFCAADRKSFAEVFEKITQSPGRVKILNRLKLRLNNMNDPVNVLNDILVCHKNPAAMSRYYFTVNGIKEGQRSSGLWISTAAGSSGAIKSAGGRVLPKESRLVQYLPRELFRCEGKKCTLAGGVIGLKQPMTVRSMMRNGAIYIDGAHLKFSFGFGDVAYISLSKEPLKVIDYDVQ